MRVPTLHTSQSAFDAIENRQSQQARLQSQIASGLRVQSPGDDPAAAAQAELARSRLTRLAQDQRATQLAGSVLATADGALAQATEMLQSAREGLVAAGDGAYSASDRQALALQLRNAREQLLVIANSRDGAGGYVFGGQGSAGNPMTGAATPAYAPAAGQQRIGEDGRYAVTVDGRSSFMAVAQGNGVFVTASAAANAGTGWIDPGSVADPTQLTGHDYRITVAGTPGALTYSVADLTAGSSVASNVPYSAGSAITFDGQRVTLDGTPAAGDSFDLKPAKQQSVFQTLDQAIALLENPASAKDHEGLQRVQTSLDRALDGMIFTRSRVGADLRHVENAAALGEQQELGVTERRSNLQDLDLARGISDLQATQTGLEAALKSYTSLSRNSLFTLMG